MNTNRIDSSSPSLVQQTSVVQKAFTNAKGAPTFDKAASVSTSDQTSLSTASTLLAQALQTPDVRTEKVASLQAAISAGTYQVSSSDVADKLIDSLLR